LNPSFFEAYNNIGVILEEMGQLDKALEAVNKAILLNENQETLYYNRGNLNIKLDNKELAISDFQKACALGSREACSALAALRTMITPDRKKE
jgi:tetratricopeptide (TPR) repeat protein